MTASLPAAYAPHLYRQYLETLLRYEQLLRAGDGAAAQMQRAAAGLRSAFVERALEKGPSGRADRLPDAESDLQASDFIDLARQLEATDG